MEEPLGEAVGNNLEVIEALRTLQGSGPEDVKEICLALAGMMLSLAKTKEGETALSFEEGKEEAYRHRAETSDILTSRSALKRQR